MAFSGSFSKKINKSKSSSSLLSNLTNTTAANSSFAAATTNTNDSPSSLITKPDKASAAPPAGKNFNFLSKASHSYSLNKILTNASHMLNNSNTTSTSSGGRLNRTVSPSTPKTPNSLVMRMSDSDDYSSGQASYRYINTPAAFFDSNHATSDTNAQTSANNNDDDDDDENIFYNVNNFPMSSHNKQRRRDRFLNKLGVKKKPALNTESYSNFVNNNKYGMMQPFKAAAPNGKQNTRSANNINEAYASYMNSCRNMQNNGNEAIWPDNFDKNNNSYNNSNFYQRKLCTSFFKYKLS
jgi:hypothetical protein